MLDFYVLYVIIQVDKRPLLIAQGLEMERHKSFQSKKNEKGVNTGFRTNRIPEYSTSLSIAFFLHLYPTESCAVLQPRRALMPSDIVSGKCVITRRAASVQGSCMMPAAVNGRALEAPLYAAACCCEDLEHISQHATLPFPRL